MASQKKVYIELCKTEASISIFMQSDWLDAAATEGGATWDVVLSQRENGIIDAALVFQIRKKWGFTLLNEPPLSPFCGVWFREKNYGKQYEQYHFIKNALDGLIKQLPPYDFANFRFHFSLTDWQPFYWAGFEQTTRYTYVLNLKNANNFFKNFNQNTQRNIQKSKKVFDIKNTESLDEFLKISHLTFDRQKIKNPIPYSTWQSIEHFLISKNQRKIYLATKQVNTENDTEGAVEAAIYVIFDKNTAYYMAGGATDIGRKNGALHGLLFQAIQDAQGLNLDFFDFEGSMLQGVEAFFRGFNGEQKAYFKVWKYQNTFLNWLKRV